MEVMLTVMEEVEAEVGEHFPSSPGEDPLFAVMLLMKLYQAHLVRN